MKEATKGEVEAQIEFDVTLEGEEGQEQWTTSLLFSCGNGSVEPVRMFCLCRKAGQTFPLQVRSIPDIGPERLDKSSDLSKWLEDYFRCEEVQGLLSDLACFNLFTRGLTMTLASDG